MVNQLIYQLFQEKSRKNAFIPQGSHRKLHKELYLFILFDVNRDFNVSTFVISTPCPALLRPFILIMVKITFLALV